MSDENLSDILQKFLERTSGEQVSLGDLLDALDQRSFGPLLLTPALIALSPVGAIPGMSIVTGSIIILISVQMFFTSHPWLPSRLLDFRFSREHLKKGIDALMPWVKWLEKGIHRRYTFLTRSPADYVIAICSILLSLLFFPLALVPGGVAPPSGAIVLFAIALTAHDGLLAATGFAIGIAAAGMAIWLWPF